MIGFSIHKECDPTGFFSYEYNPMVEWTVQETRFLSNPTPATNVTWDFTTYPYTLICDMSHVHIQLQ